MLTDLIVNSITHNITALPSQPCSISLQIHRNIGFKIARDFTTAPMSPKLGAWNRLRHPTSYHPFDLQSPATQNPQ